MFKQNTKLHCSHTAPPLQRDRGQRKCLRLRNAYRPTPSPSKWEILNCFSISHGLILIREQINFYFSSGFVLCDLSYTWEAVPFRLSMRFYHCCPFVCLPEGRYFWDIFFLANDFPLDLLTSSLAGLWRGRVFCGGFANFSKKHDSFTFKTITSDRGLLCPGKRNWPWFATGGLRTTPPGLDWAGSVAVPVG